LEEKRRRCDELAQQYAPIGYPRFEDFERDILLKILDAQWKDHLHSMDGLREGVGLRGYASRDPKIEYQREGYALFEEMNARIDEQVMDVVWKFALPQPVLERAPAPAPPPLAGPRAAGRRAGAPPASALALGAAPGPGRPPGAARPARGEKAVKVGRNDPCPCGSGKKYKKCCGSA
jgi:preprotein translocase subunit SecA